MGELAAEMGLEAASSSFFLSRSHMRIWDEARMKLSALVPRMLPCATYVPPRFVWRNALQEPNTPFSGLQLLNPPDLEEMLSHPPLAEGWPFVTQIQSRGRNTSC